MSKENIFVGPLSSVNPTVKNTDVGYLVTLINDQTMIDTPPSISPNKHLRLAMNDISEPQPGMVIPGDDHVSELLDFVIAWDQQQSMLIHCWAGISRSTAAAYIALCALNPEIGERRIAQTLRAASPTATPNRRLVTLADDLLTREGRMISAIDEIGRGQTTMEGQLFKLPARLAV